MTNIRKIYAEINDEWMEIQLYVNGEVGDITLECMSKEDYECLEDIAGREVCSDELCELYPIYSDTEDLKERFNDEFENGEGVHFSSLDELDAYLDD